jgi:nucleolar protein 9
VLETLLDVVDDARRRSHDSEMEGVLEEFAGTATEFLFDMVRSKYGSFVARRLVGVLAGISKDGNKTKMSDNGGEGEDVGTTRSYVNGAKKNLVRKVEGASRSHHHDTATTTTYTHPNVRVDLLENMWRKLLSNDGDMTSADLYDLQTSSFAGPFLKVLLEAVAIVGDEQQRSDVVISVLGGNPAIGPDSVSSDSLYRLMTDRSGSHLVEAALAAAPDGVFTKLCSAGFKGRLPALAQHPSANFAVQAAISNVKKPQQLKRMFEDLKDCFSALLKGRRGGVVTVLLAAAGKLNTLQSECSKTLWESLKESFPTQKTPLHSLLTLDTTVELGVPTQGGNKKLSSLGCAAAVSLFQYPKGMTRDWNQALERMEKKEVCSIALDPGGCRVLESYLGHEDTTTDRANELLAKIQGSWADIACFGSGNKFVERCFVTCKDASIKKDIALEVARAETRVAATHRGPALLALCRVADIKADEKTWERRLETADATRKEFEEIIFDDSTKKKASSDDAKDKKKKKKKKHKRDDDNKGDKEKKNKKKKSKKEESD